MDMGAVGRLSVQSSWRQWLGLAVIAQPCLLYSMDLTVLNLALPALSADFKPSATQLLWIVDIYGFVLAGMLIPMGTLGDHIGRRRLLLIGAAAFGVTSVLAAFSRNAEMLIGMRALLGVAGATLAPATLSLIRNMFPDPAARAIAVSVWMSSYFVGAAIGPAVGGVLLEYFSWRSVFLVSVPFMLVVLALGPLLLPEYRNNAAGPLDLLSAAMSIAAILSTVYGLKSIAEYGFSSTSLISVVAGLAIGGLFIRRQMLLSVPLIDLQIFRTPAVTVALGTYALVCFVISGVYVLLGQYLQLVLKLQPIEAGLWTLPLPAGYLIGSASTSLITRYVRQESVLIGGLVLGAAGFFMLACLGEDSTAISVAIACATYAVGLGPVLTLVAGMTVSGAPSRHAGAAAAISEAGSELGGALGIALLGSLSVTLYRLAMTSALPPGSLFPDVSTLGGAVELAHRLGGALGDQILEVSRHAFTHGLRIVALVGSVSLICAAVWVRQGLTAAAPLTAIDDAAEN